MVNADRGQILTLEAFIASVVLLGSLVFALQVTAVTPMSTSTSNEQIESQQGRLAAGTLDSALANETLRPAILAWNASNTSFHDASERGYYRNGIPRTEFGTLLEQNLGDRAIAYNVNLQYIDTQGATRRQELVNVGTPTDDVVSVSRTVTLYDDDVLYDAAGNPTNTSLSDTSRFYAPDAAPNSSLYNVVRVQVVVWRR